MNKVAAIAVTFGGLAAGYLLGSVFSLQLATNWLDRYAKLTAAQDDASFAEARSVLSSAAGLALFQLFGCGDCVLPGLVSHSEYLKDAGRMRGGKIECSAVSQPTRLQAQSKPGIQRRTAPLFTANSHRMGAVTRRTRRSN